MSDAPPSRVFTIDVISDVVCPWCYIGKRRLSAALARVALRHRAVDFAVSWHPFELNPDLPAAGIDRAGYVERKFGGPERAAEVLAGVEAAGASVGIPFAFALVERQPNTLAAHRLIHWAQQQGPADALVEQLFRAHFVEGRWIGAHAVLAALAADAGLSALAAQALLDSDAGTEQVRVLERRVRELGVDGVPFFVFDSRAAVSGAQEPAALVDVIDELLATPLHRE